MQARDAVLEAARFALICSALLGGFCDKVSYVTFRRLVAGSSESRFWPFAVCTVVVSGICVGFGLRSWLKMQFVKVHSSPYGHGMPLKRLVVLKTMLEEVSSRSLFYVIWLLPSRPIESDELEGMSSLNVRLVIDM